MKIKDLRTKSDKELKSLLAAEHESLREANFKVAQKQLKNVRKIRVIKRNIGQILTLLNDKSYNQK